MNRRCDKEKINLYSQNIFLNIYKKKKKALLQKEEIILKKIGKVIAIRQYPSEL